MILVIHAFLYGAVCFGILNIFASDEAVHIIGSCASALLLCTSIWLIYNNHKVAKRDGFECPYEKEKQDSKGE